MSKVAHQETLDPPSPEDGSNFRRSLEIDMKGLVGDAVGNMSISPESRDVVLATRKGLFIIDLEAPLNVPRFLPQGGTWDVADVQWNPHTSRSEYIVSTSSEKLLIWNLFLTGRTSIEHVLRSHYRAITDINWHTTDPDIVVSTGIDSWLWAWDLRAIQKPVMGLCAFGSGGTQVKWNRQNGHILASSHQNEVLVWDRRKGTLPISRIKAHTAKIYGIDWAHDRSNEIVTCSLDKTIKVWDTQTFEPKVTIETAYPVWRARDLPFGRGLLSLPQRGETALELYGHENPKVPVEIYAGHADVVKEFVWRRGGPDSSDFQLITWSKDKTLRFWPVDAEVMQKVGTTLSTRTPTAEPTRRDLKVSFSNPPIGTDLPPALSAPVGHRGILAEVRAPFPPRPSRINLPRRQLDRENSPPASGGLNGDTLSAPSKPIPITQQHGGTMTRGNLGGRSTQITPLAWLSSVKVGAKRDSSSGRGSGAESMSRFSSRSRPPSAPDRSVSQTMSRVNRSNEAGDKKEDIHRENDIGQSLQDEITSVVNRLSASKVKLERVDLTKKRTCTFGLHGPWGDNTSVFVRVSFTFPRDYPQAEYPDGMPNVNLEKNSLISNKSRAFILRRLRTIRERHRPCLEKCLRFLLFGDEDEHIGRHMGMDSESSSDDDDIPVETRNRRRPSFSLLHNGSNVKNLAEPRTSQGVFGVNGELVCFFRAPPRIVVNPMREISVSPSIAPRGADSNPRLFQPPALLSDALRRLGDAAYDRNVDPMDSQQAHDANNILRIMANLFTFSHQNPRRLSEHSRPYEDIPASYSLLPTRRSTVYINDASALTGIDIAGARNYSLTALDPPEFCKTNAQIANARGRPDHERFFRLLEAILTSGGKNESRMQELTDSHVARDLPTLQVMDRLYRKLSAEKDIQMLAMLSILLLRISLITPLEAEKMPSSSTPGYRRPLNRRNLSLSPVWSRTSPSPSFQPVAPALASPSSSRGSWSSLFNTSSVKQLVAGSKVRSAISVPERPGTDREYSSHQIRSRDPSVQPTYPVPKSWSEMATFPPIASTVTFSSAGHTRRRTFSQMVSAQSVAVGKRRVIVNLLPEASSSPGSLQSDLRDQLLCHINTYAEMLLAWSLPEKRSELLKAVEKYIPSTAVDFMICESMLRVDTLGSVSICEHGVQRGPSGAESCSACAGSAHPVRCSICRLPVKGLSHACLVCSHMTHITCWNSRKGAFCPSGCGCRCSHPSDSTPIVTGVMPALSPLRM